MNFLFFLLLSFSATVSWFRFCPRNSSDERSSATLLLGVVIVLMFFYANSLNLLGYFIMNTADWKKSYLADFGLIPAWLHVTAFAVYVLGGLALVIFTLTMVRYRNSARVWLMRCIPVVAIPQGINIYKSYAHIHGVEQTQNTLLLFIMISLLLHAGIYLFLDSVRIRKYFNAL